MKNQIDYIKIKASARRRRRFSQICLYTLLSIWATDRTFSILLDAANFSKKL